MNEEKYTWCKLEEARDCERKDDHSHISIQSPDAKPFAVKCKREKLSMDFIDLDPREIMRTRTASFNPKRAEELAAGCMTVEEANQIVLFVEAHPGPIVVNCEAGISRSPGLVMALREWYGGSVHDVLRNAVPNMHVAFTMAYVLRLRDSWSKCDGCKGFIKYGESIHTVKRPKAYGAIGPAEVLLTLCGGCRAELVS